jgi:DNA transformation protein and related proteins
MSEALCSICNIGPTLEVAFIKAGIEDAQILWDIGVDEGYLKLLKKSVQHHFIGYYVIPIGLQGRA